jgi:protein-S-isoprenylcysteine O-methyltransferase Ste14
MGVEKFANDGELRKRGGRGMHRVVDVVFLVGWIAFWGYDAEGGPGAGHHPSLPGAYFTYSAVMEERYMAEKLPDSYPAYQRSSKMLIPFIF